MIVQVLCAHTQCRTHDIAEKGAWAILNVAWSDELIQQRFVAGGARPVLEAIIADPASSAEAQEKAREALKKLGYDYEPEERELLTDDDYSSNGNDDHSISVSEDAHSGSDSDNEILLP